MNKKSIVFIGQSYPTGVYHLLAEFGAALNRHIPHGIDFYFAASGEEATPGVWDLIRSSIPPHNLLVGTNFQDLVRRIAILLDMYDCTVIHAGGGLGQMKWLVPLKRKFGDRVKIIVTTHAYRHNTWLRIPMALVQNVVYGRYADKVIFQCPYAARRFTMAERLMQMGKGVVLPLACESFANVSDVVPASVVSARIDKQMTNNLLFKIIYLAQLHAGKRHLWLIESLKDVLKKHPTARLILCGRGPLRDRIAERIKQLGLEAQIVLAGQLPRKDIPWMLKHSNVSVVTTKSETFGHTYVEPMMAGIPVVGTRIGVGEYLLRDYENGLGFPVHGSDILARHIEYVISHPTICREMGERARKMAEMWFDEDELALAHIALCEELFR